MIQYQRFRAEKSDERKEVMDFLNSGIEVLSVSEYMEDGDLYVAVYYYGPEEISGQ